MNKSFDYYSGKDSVVLLCGSCHQGVGRPSDAGLERKGSLERPLKMDFGVQNWISVRILRGIMLGLCLIARPKPVLQTTERVH